MKKRDRIGNFLYGRYPFEGMPVFDHRYHFFSPDHGKSHLGRGKRRSNHVDPDLGRKVGGEGESQAFQSRLGGGDRAMIRETGAGGHGGNKHDRTVGKLGQQGLDEPEGIDYVRLVGFQHLFGTDTLEWPENDFARTKGQTVNDFGKFIGKAFRLPCITGNPFAIGWQWFGLTAG